jgi:hypothetical protein
VPIHQRTAFLIVGAAGLLAASQMPVWAVENTYEVALSGAAEVPPITSKATGNAEITFDTATKKLGWTVTYSGLSGPISAAGVNGPSAAGANAAAIVPLQGDFKSPMKGSVTLTDAQAKDFLAGMMYVNIQTAANPGGEIRGQISMDTLFDPNALGLQGE